MQDVETKAQRKCEEGNAADCTLDGGKAETPERDEEKRELC